MVQEGVTWFTDPPDDQLEVKIDVKPSSNPPPPPDAGTKPDAGHDAGGTTIGDNEDTTVQGGGGGCSTSGTKPSGSLAFGALALFGIVLVARRKRSS